MISGFICITIYHFDFSRELFKNSITSVNYVTFAIPLRYNWATRNTTLDIGGIFGAKSRSICTALCDAGFSRNTNAWLTVNIAWTIQFGMHGKGTADKKCNK
jgi:hypothetical protein